jgi:hypothetical protein
MEQCSELRTLKISGQFPLSAVRLLLHLLPHCLSMCIEEIRLGTKRCEEHIFLASDWEALDGALAKPQFMGLRRLGFCTLSMGSSTEENRVSKVTVFQRRLPLCHARGILVVDVI